MTTTDDPRIVPEIIAAPPERTIEEERLHRKQRLAATFRLFGKFGFDEGVAGHVTVRDPEFPDLFYVNPFGKAFSNAIVVDHDHHEGPHRRHLLPHFA